MSIDDICLPQLETMRATLVRAFEAKTRDRKTPEVPWKALYARYRDGLEDMVDRTPVAPGWRPRFRPLSSLGNFAGLIRPWYGLIRDRMEFVSTSDFFSELHKTFRRFFRGIRGDETFHMPFEDYVTGKSNLWIFFLMVKFAEESGDERVARVLRRTRIRKNLDIYLLRRRARGAMVLLCDDVAYSGSQMSSHVMGALSCMTRVAVVVPFVSEEAMRLLRKCGDAEIISTRRIPSIFPKKLTLRRFLEIDPRFSVEEYEEGEPKFYQPILLQSTRSRGCATIFQHKFADRISLPRHLSNHTCKGLPPTQTKLRVVCLGPGHFTKKQLDAVLADIYEEEEIRGDVGEVRELAFREPQSLVDSATHRRLCASATPRYKKDLVLM